MVTIDRKGLLAAAAVLAIVLAAFAGLCAEDSDAVGNGNIAGIKNIYKVTVDADEEFEAVRIGSVDLV